MDGFWALSIPKTHVKRTDYRHTSRLSADRLFIRVKWNLDPPNCWQRNWNGPLRTALAAYLKTSGFSRGMAATFTLGWEDISFHHPYSLSWNNHGHGSFLCLSAEPSSLPKSPTAQSIAAKSSLRPTYPAPRPTLAVVCSCQTIFPLCYPLSQGFSILYEVSSSHEFYSFHRCVCVRVRRHARYTC